MRKKLIANAIRQSAKDNDIPLTHREQLLLQWLEESWYRGIFFFSTKEDGTQAKVERVIRRMQRNPFFIPSEFEEQEKISISEYKSDNRKRLDKIKERKRAERKLHKHAKHNSGMASLDAIIKAEKSMTTMPKKGDNQIQRGLDLAKEWGWNGIDKTYQPTLMKAR